MANNIITIQNLNFSFKDKTIFQDINLTIQEGSFISLMGPNGTGKSTLIKIISGLLPYDGYISICGYYLNNENINKIRRTLGVVLDEIDNQFIGETVKDDLAFNLENLEYQKDEIEKEINNISLLFNLKNVLDKDPLTLDESTKQTVTIASSLIHKPRILLLDESFQHLNKKDKETVIKALSYYQKEYNLTIILITHNEEDTLYTSRLIILNKSKIYLDDTPQNIYKNPKQIKNLGMEVPFIIKLSHNLELYNLTDKLHLTIESLVDELW